MNNNDKSSVLGGCFMLHSFFFGDRAPIGHLTGVVGSIAVSDVVAKKKPYHARD
jgi:hypothetical protein